MVSTSFTGSSFLEDWLIGFQHAQKPSSFMPSSFFFYIKLLKTVNQATICSIVSPTEWRSLDQWLKRVVNKTIMVYSILTIYNQSNIYAEEKSEGITDITWKNQDTNKEWWPKQRNTNIL